MSREVPETARICNVSIAEEHNCFLLNALEPIQHAPAHVAPIYAHTGEKLISTIDAGELGVPVLKHVHHAHPHYVNGQLYILVHGWSLGKYAVLKHEPEAPSQPVNGVGGRGATEPHSKGYRGW